MNEIYKGFRSLCPHCGSVTDFTNFDVNKGIVINLIFHDGELVRVRAVCRSCNWWTVWKNKASDKVNCFEIAKTDRRGRRI